MCYTYAIIRKLKKTDMLFSGGINIEVVEWKK